MDIAIRSLVAFLLVLAVTRVVGRRELSTLEPFDVIMLVVIGDLVQQGVTQSDYSITGTLIVLSVVTLMTALFAYLNFRFPKLRPWMDGTPGRPDRCRFGDRAESASRAPDCRRGRSRGPPAADRLAQPGPLGGARANGRISFIPDSKEVPSIFAEDEGDEPVEIWAVLRQSEDQDATKVEDFWEPSTEATRHRS